MVAGKLKIFVKSYYLSRSYWLVSETWGFEGIKCLGVEIKLTESSPNSKNYMEFCDFSKIKNILLDVM